jgi:mannose-6-phosphate isomerase-like protein (cupin superfamily)
MRQRRCIWRARPSNMARRDGCRPDLDQGKDSIVSVELRQAKKENEMHGYVAPIEKLAKDNDDFRRVLFTSGKMQLVLMTLKSGEAIGTETHSTHDQFFRIEKGKGRIRIGNSKIQVSAGDAILVPAGLKHNLTNTGKTRLCLYTIYAPPNHVDHLVEPANSAAVAEEGRKEMIDEGSPVRPGQA